VVVVVVVGVLPRGWGVLPWVGVFSKNITFSEENFLLV
jgi:hypothetical protein